MNNSNVFEGLTKEYGIASTTDNYLDKENPLGCAKRYLKTFISEEIILNHISDELALEIYNDFASQLERKIEKIIEEKYNQVKVPVGTKVKMLYEGFKKQVSTIVEVKRFSDDTFGYGWYIYTLDSGDVVYRKEFEIIE